MVSKDELRLYPDHLPCVTSLDEGKAPGQLVIYTDTTGQVD